MIIFTHYKHPSVGAELELSDAGGLAGQVSQRVGARGPADETMDCDDGGGPDEVELGPYAETFGTAAEFAEVVHPGVVHPTAQRSSAWMGVFVPRFVVRGVMSRWAGSE